MFKEESHWWQGIPSTSSIIPNNQSIENKINCSITYLFILSCLFWPCLDLFWFVFCFVCFLFVVLLPFVGSSHCFLDFSFPFWTTIGRYSILFFFVYVLTHNTYKQNKYYSGCRIYYTVERYRYFINLIKAIIILVWYIISRCWCILYGW